MMYRRIKYILRTKGLIYLLKRGFLFVAYRFRSLFYKVYALCYLYETDILYAIKEKNEEDFRPKLQNIVFNMVPTNQRADEMEASGLEFRSYNSNYREWLEKGAIAFCIFIDKEFANIFWVAINEEAKKVIDPIPYKVDFACKEACVSEIWTNQKYRGKRLMIYGLFKGAQVLSEMGILKCKACISIRKKSSFKFVEIFGSRNYAKGRYARILLWKYWSEKPRLD